MQKNWSNTALVAYSALPKIVKELDLTLKRLVNSSFKSVHLKSGISTMQLISEIMEINEEKRKIVNLHFIVSTALDGMSEEARRLVIGKILQKRTFNDLSKELGLSLRTVFRRFEKAQEEYAGLLTRAGYTESWLEQEYGNDKYLKPIRIRLLEDKYFVSHNQ